MSWSNWWSALQQRAEQAPLRPRDTFLLAGQTAAIGSIEPALAGRMVGAGLPLATGSIASTWQVTGPADDGLRLIAEWLAAHGLCARWRNERLAVTDSGGSVVAKIERAAVRPLGIATRAVHLVGRTPQGGFWVQQRARDKTTDPGLWDTMMGGLMAAEETIAQTLARETWEEAGLQIDQLSLPVSMADLVIRRPVTEGYMVERIHVFTATVPDAVTPVNQDGEVERFEAIDAAALRERLMADAFTLEATLILARFLPAA